MSRFRPEHELSGKAAFPAALLCFALALGVYASTASAAPFSLTFTEARANVGVQLSDAALFETPDTAPLEAQIGPAGESITAGDLDVPQFSTHITSPIDADVTVDFDVGVISGSFIEGAGGLTLGGTAGGTLKANGKECTVSTTPAVLALSTSQNSGGTIPRTGAPFTHGLTGSGAIAGQWTDMQASPVDPEPGGDTAFCENVEDQIEGPGGIWLEQAGDVVPPLAPQLTSTDPPAPGGLSRTPRILGTAEVGSTVRIFAGATCGDAPVVSGGASELNSPGLQVTVPVGTTGVFSATATDPAGNTSPCSTPISYSVQHLDPGVRCVVPKLIGRKLEAAKKALLAAHCNLGRVLRPRRRRGKHGPLVVKSSKPAAGTMLEAGGKVSLRLRPKSR